MSDTISIYKKTVIELFEEQVKKTPHLIALQDKTIQFTYLELNERVNQITCCLRKKSIHPMDMVALLLEPSSDFIIFMLAIIKVGAAYVPIDTMAPQTRLQELIDDAKPKLIITNEEFLIKLQDIDCTCSLTKQINLESISYSKEDASESVLPDSPIYMMYTSGSTGKPKGVIIPHGAVVNLVKIDNYASVTEKDVVAQFSNLSFDGSTFEIWSAFLNGATLFIVPLSARSNHNELNEIVQQHKVSHLFLPTGFFHQLVKSAPDTLDSVQNIIFGGEQANKNLLRNFLQARKNQQNPVVLINGYGPTEATTFTCKHVMNEHCELDDEQLVCIGSAIANVKTYILDEGFRESIEGELYISGINLALGYHNSVQNQEKFIKNMHHDNAPYNRLYKTGDRVRKLPSGELLCLGRLDDQVKIGGFRIHLNEIEQQLMKHPDIALAAVTVELGGSLHKMLTAYLVFSSRKNNTHADDIRAFLNRSLPTYMLPVKYVMVEDLPLTVVGKVDKKNLHIIPHTDLSCHIDMSSSSSIEETIKGVWQHLLNRRHIETHKNLFELGANSLLITEACVMLNEQLNSELQIADMLSYPTIHKLSRYLEGDVEPAAPTHNKKTHTSDIAIIGMSCRFPGANSINEFWDNLCEGKDCLTRFDKEEIKNEAASNKNFVPVKGILNDIEQFDASFFGFSPVDARVTDPQHRLFIECVWEALEHAGVAPEKNPTRTISVFSGMTDSTYLQEHLLKNHWFCNEHDLFQQRIATSIGMLSTQVSYRLNLKGRSVNVNTACSTGLMTVDQACQDLIAGQSDIALAGASSIVLPQINGYLYQEGSIVSSDGTCRPFSDNANGTVFSNGVGAIVLKRLADAIEEGDTIYAVIKSSSVNNDGADKLGFTAPSLSGQMSCIREALAEANINASDVGFVEAHGTATALGDVIEINALTSVYREQSDKQGYCALGSVKANIGHTDVTAGIAGLIKAALCLHHKKIPPLIHFNAPNPNLALEKSPFFVNSKVLDWQENAPNLYAGVSAFGVGGTNIHVILSDYKKPEPKNTHSVTEELFLFSAKSEPALKMQIQNICNFMRLHNPSSNEWSNSAYTLQTGRENFQWRQFIVSKNADELQHELPHKVPKFVDEDIHHSIVLMFSGQGTQYPHMAMGLYNNIPLFKKYIDLGVKLAKPYLNCKLLDIINSSDTSQINQTEYTQPALFIIEYALSQLIMDCGIKPDALIGHSIGEYVAACIAGVFSFEDGIALVCERGLLMSKTEKGSMLALECTEEELLAYQEIARFDLALHNATHHRVLSGSLHEIAQLTEHLASIGKPFHELKVSHAFHSQLMEPLEQSFKSIFANIKLSPPQIPIVSNVTGTWLSASEALDPAYWYQHLRHTVQFHQGIKLLLDDQHPLFVEVGLGQSLLSFVKMSSKGKANTLFTLPSHHQKTSDLYQLQTCFGELWASGINIHPQTLFQSAKRQRIPLPTYPFQKQRHWVEADKKNSMEQNTQLYKPVWSYKTLNTSFSIERMHNYDWIIFKNKHDAGTCLVEFLLEQNIRPYIIEPGAGYKEITPFQFEINLADKSDYVQVISKIKNRIRNPIVFHSLSSGDVKNEILDTNQLGTQLDISFYSLLYVTQAYIKEIGSHVPMNCFVISSGVYNVLGNDPMCPANASLIGTCRVIPMEQPSMHYQFIDIEVNDFKRHEKAYLLNMVNQCLHDEWSSNQPIIAYRNGYKWDVDYVPIAKKNPILNFADNGIYLITGGIGGIGLSISEVIATEAVNPTLILCSRNFCIPEFEWDNIMRNPAHPSHQKIARLNKLKALGAKVYCVQSDVSNTGEVDSLFHMIKNKFKVLNGIIHSAGIAGAGLAQLKSKSKAHQIFLPKIYGTYNLAKACKHMPPLDFVVLMSSIAAITGEQGQIDYCGANACLDAFATSALFPKTLTLSINWNTWREVGMSIEIERPAEMSLFERGNSIGVKEGQSLFLSALSHQYSNLIVSNYGLHEYTQRLHEKKHSDSSAENKILRETLDIQTLYSAPTNEIESSLAQLWQEHLQIETIGRNDDFFNLGGHSLKAISLIERINKIHNSNLSIQHLYQAPTIAKLSKYFNNKNKSIDIVVNLKNDGVQKPAVFFFHPISGMIYCFNSLVSQLNIPASIYAIQDPSIAEGKLLYRSVLEMAQSYVTQIKNIQPSGPYFLAGYSFGGTIAYEVAHILKEQNEKIALLGLIDSWCIFSKSQQNKQHFINNYLSHDLQASKELAHLAWERMELLLKHKPTELQQDMILFKASALGDDYCTINHPLNGWPQFNKGTIVCHSVNASHDSIINNEQIPSILSEYILNFL